MTATLYPGGYNGRLVSLGGIYGRENMGYTVYSTTGTPTTAIGTVLGPNPARLFALITNDGAVDVQIAWDDTFTNGLHLLRPGGQLLINKDLPWIGPVCARTLAGTGSIGVEAASVQP